jgi:O-antigen/teichoic acid export membrane protein/CelD/BcsL family acetyltransferase involved in cellulose biosynthesis
VVYQAGSANNGKQIVSIADLYRTGRNGRAGILPLLSDWFREGNDDLLAQRTASATFAIRVASAALAYATQVVLARWLGAFEFGVYVYVWTWTLLIGGFVDAGLAVAAQKFIPAYSQQKAFDLLRGFLVGSRRLALATATTLAVASGAFIWFGREWFNSYELVPLWVACLSLPFFAMTSLQDGIARCYNWVDISLLPSFVVRPLLMLAVMLTASRIGFASDATTAMVATAISLWLAAAGQAFVLRRRLQAKVPAGPRSFEPLVWLRTSTPIVMVVGFYILLTYVDVIVLRQYVPPEEVALYHAASKTISLITFVYFAVASATAHRFSEYHAAGDRQRLSALVTSAVHWTFWPSLALGACLLILGRPLLWLFGPSYLQAYPLMFILTIGLLARASVGPAERLLNMLGHQAICAGIFAVAFVVNLGGCVALVPRFGGVGAAIATSTALIVESIMLFAVTKRRLGFHAFVVRARAPKPSMPRRSLATTLSTAADDLIVERHSLSDMETLVEPWRELCRRAVQPNVFYEPAFALAAAAVFGKNVEVLVLRSPADPERLLGLLPCRIERRGGFPVLVGWTHPYAPLGMPLIDGDHAVQGIAALLDHIRTDESLPSCLLLPLIPQDGAFKSTLDRVIAQREMSIATFDPHQRALLAPQDDRLGYLGAALSTTKRRQLQRLRRGLERTGPVEFEMTSDVARTLPSFFALETSGWKGAAGTAASQDDAIKSFVTRAVTDLASEHKAHVLRMLHNGAPIAAGLALRSGNGLWSWKIAYDERAARASPGSQLSLDFTAALLKDEGLVFADSCAGPAMPMIDQIWRERLPLADHLIGPRSNATFAMIRMFEIIRRHARGSAKELRKIIRG